MPYRARLRSLKSVSGSDPGNRQSIDAVSLADHLRLDIGDDRIVRMYAPGAIDLVQRWTGRALLDGSWRATFDGWADEIAIPIAPATAITSIEYVDADGVTRTLPTSDYVTCLDAEPAVISLRSGKSWPTADTRPGAIIVTFAAGYGANHYAVPHGLGLAIMALVAHFHEHREPVVTGTVTAQVPLHVERMLEPFRLPWVT